MTAASVNFGLLVRVQGTSRPLATIHKEIDFSVKLLGFQPRDGLDEFRPCTEWSPFVWSALRQALGPCANATPDSLEAIATADSSRFTHTTLNGPNHCNFLGSGAIRESGD